MKIEKEKIAFASTLTRILAFLIDTCLVIFLSVFGSALAARIAQNVPGKVKDNIALETLNVSSSHLVTKSNNRYLYLSNNAANIEYIKTIADIIAITKLMLLVSSLIFISK